MKNNSKYSKESLQRIDFLNLQSLITKSVVKSCLCAASANAVCILQGLFDEKWKNFLFLPIISIFVIIAIISTYHGILALKESDRRLKKMIKQ